jgi:hypothetical protein
MRSTVTLLAVLVGLVLLPGLAFAAGKSRHAQPPPHVYHPHPHLVAQTEPSVPF